MAAKIDAEQVLCRFQLSSLIRHGSSPLYEWIVETAHHEGLRGATVLKGFFGLRPEGSVLEEHSWSFSQDVPVIVEVVDEPARIEALLAKVEPVFREGVITLERAHVLVYRAGVREASSPLIGRNIIATATTSAAHGVRTMKVPEHGVLLRIFIGESDKEPGSGRPLYEAIVRRARHIWRAQPCYAARWGSAGTRGCTRPSCSNYRPTSRS
jgi:hypothetical protein